ncbi:MAG TPA: acylphosphatase, partial [Polyangiaceae bacterium]|nr:acylphosphatase [Polyangiaceae bacterium]
MIVRRAVIVTGVVQGVGFRPFVHTAASELGLGGFVRNESGAVHIEIEGEERRLDDLVRRLRASPPPLARVESIHVEACEARGEREFRIDHSVSTSAERVFHSADIATCSACLAELFDPSNRRYRYPFLNCTNCGPRFSIAMSSPYDRERTTMAGFTMCRPCQQEYDDPRNRRFHAQPTACAACGPRARWLDAAGNDLAVADPVTACAEAIARGQIV